MTENRSRSFHCGLAGVKNPKKIGSQIEGLAGRRNRRLRLKIHRLVMPDGVRSDELRGTRKAPEAARLLAFSILGRFYFAPSGRSLFRPQRLDQFSRIYHRAQPRKYFPGEAGVHFGVVVGATVLDHDYAIIGVGRVQKG